jgi:predicted exporter
LLEPEAGPSKSHGVWLSADGTWRAPLLVQTRAAGFDIDGQSAPWRALLRSALDAVATEQNAGQSRRASLAQVCPR